MNTCESENRKVERRKVPEVVREVEPALVTMIDQKQHVLDCLDNNKEAIRCMGMETVDRLEEQNFMGMQMTLFGKGIEVMEWVKLRDNKEKQRRLVEVGLLIGSYACLILKNELRFLLDDACLLRAGGELSEYTRNKVNEMEIWREQVNGNGRFEDDLDAMVRRAREWLRSRGLELDGEWDDFR